MRNEVFAPSAEGEARLLLLVDAFSAGGEHLQGRVKLAKLDFLLRYPRFYERAMRERGRKRIQTDPEDPVIEERMVRYRYGPWDPAYYALIGRLLGRGLITTVPAGRYIGFRVTEAGHETAQAIAETAAWEGTANRARTLRTEFHEHRGTWLQQFIYRVFPEVAGADWGHRL